MAEVKTKKNEASVEDFLASVSDERRRRDCFTVLDLMQKATGEPPEMWGASIVGFGSRRYVYASGQSGDWPIIGFSPRKQDLTLYVLDSFPGQEELLQKLGKHKTGKCCLYLKKLADVDMATLEELINASITHQG